MLIGGFSQIAQHFLFVTIAMENLTHSIRGDKTGCSSLRLEDIFVNISNLMHLFSFSLARQSL